MEGIECGVANSWWEPHDEFFYQIWAKSYEQFVWKCVETAWQIRGQETAWIERIVVWS